MSQKQFNIAEVYAYDIMEGIKNERIHYHIDKPILTLEQARHLILHTKKTRKSIWHYRDHAIIFLMITAGLRSIEVIQAQRADYQEVEGKRILYVGKKGQQATRPFVKIAPGVERAIADYLHKRKDQNPYLFVTTKNPSPKRSLSRMFFRDMFQRVLKSCHLDTFGITPHCLRHTAGLMNLVRGASLEATQSLLRHENIKSTLVYQAYLDRLQNHTESEIDQFILKETANDFDPWLMTY